MVDSWRGPSQPWRGCGVLGLTPAILGAEGVARIGQVWGSVSQVFEEPLEVGVSLLSEVL